MPRNTSRRHICLPGIWITLFGLTVSSPGQKVVSPTKSEQKSHARAPLNDYEDSEVRVVIPNGWRLISKDGLRGDQKRMSLGGSVSEPSRGLIVEKDGFTLAIAYNTTQASGIIGGRFIEIFNIPWPGIDDIWDCSMYLHQQPEPASRVLLFENVIVDDMDPKGVESCGLSKEPGAWSDEHGMKRRWFGGYFTDSGGGYFFGSGGEGCGEKAYTLTAEERIPERLPLVEDPKLNKIIRESIDLVDSIRYKRCAPS